MTALACFTAVLSGTVLLMVKRREMPLARYCTTKLLCPPAVTIRPKPRMFACQ